MRLRRRCAPLPNPSQSVGVGPPPESLTTTASRSANMVTRDPATMTTRFLLICFCLSAATGSSGAQATDDNHLSNAVPAASLEEPYHSQSALEFFVYVDVCESHSGFERMESGMNPDSELVELHPSTWVYTTNCRHAGRPCTGYDGALSVCRSRKSWVQTVGKVAGGSTWQLHWVAVATSCTCSIKTTFPFLTPRSL